MNPAGGARAMIFGLDGASFQVLDDLTRRGVMPNLAELMATGVRGSLLSTVPPLTPVAWSSLVTGRTPGNHGVTGFFQFDAPESFSLRIVSARELRSETVWSIVNRHGLRAGSLNFPIHCPPPRIDGYVIPGWLPWKWIRMFSHPAGLVAKLQREIPGLDIRELAMDFEQEKKSIAGAAIDNHENWIELHIRRDQHWFDVLCHQLRRDPCELVGIVFDGVDKLQHLLWPYLDPALEPERPTEGFLRLRERCWDYFRQLDRFLGEVLAMVGEECTVFIVSDHGFTGTSQILHINTWLEQNGYLTWKAGME
ncbi:MAG: alkaline phosphatase family protein, partial [Acidobacteriota bacterium]